MPATQTAPTAQLLRGDALLLLPTLPDASVDAVITDPPYNSGGRTAPERSGQTARGKYVQSDAQHTLADFAGDNRDQRGYVAWLTMLLAECLRISRPGSSVLVFSDWRQLPSTSDALQAAGFIWRGVIPWRKGITRPCRNGFKRECEYILWGSNGQPFRHPDPIYLPGWLEGSQPRGTERQHITQKPVSIMRVLARICPPGGTILDPCAGAASTGVAALQEGRSFIGCELTDHYASIGHARLNAALQGAHV